MNVYDFDKTIYSGDSTLDFYFYCLKKHPGVIVCIPRQLAATLRYKAGRIDKTQFKEEFYCFFTKLRDIEADVISFWNRNEGKIKRWYRQAQEKDDLIISASPEFLLAEACKRIGVKHLIASEVNPKTGKYTGVNCSGEEKVRRFIERFNCGINRFYSDSMSDRPMAERSENSYIVKGESIRRWEKEEM